MTKFGFLAAGLLSAAALVSACGDDDSDTDFSSAGAGGGSSGAAGKGNGGSTASGGSGSSKGGSSNGGGSTGGSSAGGADGEAGNSGAGAPNVGDAGAAGEGGSGGANGGAGGSGGTAACPDLFGAYDITSAEGTCGSLDVDAMQEIAGTDVACFAHFVSNGDGPDGVNGGADLDENGNFEGAMLYLDAVQRNPCSGSWDGDAEEMTVECGGNDDLCTIVLERL